MSISDASILGEGLGLGGGETRQVDMFVNENHGHTLSSHLGCRDAKRRNLVPCHYALGRVGRFARAFTYTVHSLYLYSRFLYSIIITLRVVSQFLYTTGKSEQKLVSRFLFLDF